MDELIDKIEDWADDRNLIMGSSARVQCLKLMSEVGELADNLAKNRDCTDDIGDCMVVLIIMANQLGKTPRQCLEHAYNDIKDRKGRMINGVFVKDGDNEQI